MSQRMAESMTVYYINKIQIQIKYVDMFFLYSVLIII